MKTTLQKIWSTVVRFWGDFISYTPRVFQWFFGILISISATAGTVAFAFDRLPSAIQSTVPTIVLQVIAGASFIGAILAKKQNPKQQTTKQNEN